MKNNHKCKICNHPISFIVEDLYDDRYGYPGKFDIWHCNQCNFAQTEPEMKYEELSDLYSNYYPRKNSTKEETLREATFKPGLAFKLKSYLFGTNNICHQYAKPGSVVIDIGCGNGASLVELKNNGCTAYGTETDTNVARLAKELDLNIHIGDIADLPEKNLRFDFITASQLIEHIPNPGEFIDTLTPHLKEDGKIIFSFPNFNSLGRKLWGKTWINWHIPYHQNFFSKKNLQILADDHNLRIVKYKTVTPNIWSQLQLGALYWKPNAGNSSYLWSTDKKASKFNLSRKLLTGAIIISKYVLIIPNRIIDMLGLGESTLIIFAQK